MSTPDPDSTVQTIELKAPTADEIIDAAFDAVLKRPKEALMLARLGEIVARAAAHQRRLPPEPARHRFRAFEGRLAALETGLAQLHGLLLSLCDATVGMAETEATAEAEAAPAVAPPG